MEKINLPIKCPQCNAESTATFSLDPLELAPRIKGGVRPTNVKYSYIITSEDIKKHIIDKAHKFVSNANLEIAPRYCEKKRRSEMEPHRSYASFLIGFSHHVIANDGDNSWFQQIGETTDNVKIVKTLFDGLIKAWGYNPKQIDEWQKNYKKLERLEEGFGMDEKFINELKFYSRPRGVRTNNNDIWVFFMASPEAILNDFFSLYSEDDSNKTAGKITINDIRLLSKDIVEYNITLSPNEIELKENPHVRQILSGEEKIK